FFFFFSSRRRHTISKRDWSSDVCSSDLFYSGAVCREESTADSFLSWSDQVRTAVRTLWHLIFGRIENCRALRWWQHHRAPSAGLFRLELFNSNSVFQTLAFKLG